MGFARCKCKSCFETVDKSCGAHQRLVSAESLVVWQHQCHMAIMQHQCHMAIMQHQCHMQLPQHMQPPQPQQLQHQCRTQPRQHMQPPQHMPPQLPQQWQHPLTDTEVSEPHTEEDMD